VFNTSAGTDGDDSTAARGWGQGSVCVSALANSAPRNDKVTLHEAAKSL